MSCLMCLQNKKRFGPPTPTPKIQTCIWTLEELNQLNKETPNPYIQSQINIYHHDCNRFEKQIQSFLQTQ